MEFEVYANNDNRMKLADFSARIDDPVTLTDWRADKFSYATMYARAAMILSSYMVLARLREVEEPTI